MNKLIILIGPPGAGKSTYAASYVAMFPNTVICGRDKLRMMLYGYSEATLQQHFTHELFREREEQISLVQHQVIHAAWLQELSLIIDDTNLQPYRLKSLIERYTSEFDRIVLTFFDTDLETCLLLNKSRERIIADTDVLRYWMNYKRIREEFIQYEQTYPDKVSCEFVKTAFATAENRT